MQGRLGRFPVLQVMLGNALLLSGIYLVIGIVLELLLHLYPMKWVESATIVLDSLPARLLHAAGVLGPLTEAYAYGRLSGFWLRVAFALTTVTIIFALAAAVALAMSALTRLTRRSST